MAPFELRQPDESEARHREHLGEFKPTQVGAFGPDGHDVAHRFGEEGIQGT